MKVYFLYEWTEEREAKIHIGIYSTVEKAMVVAQSTYEDDGDHDDLPEGTYHELEWSGDASSNGLVGEKFDDGSGYSADTPFCIDEYELDTYMKEDEWVPGKPPTYTRVSV